MFKDTELFQKAVEFFEEGARSALCGEIKSIEALSIKRMLQPDCFKVIGEVIFQGGENKRIEIILDLRNLAENYIGDRIRGIEVKDIDK